MENTHGNKNDSSRANMPHTSISQLNKGTLWFPARTGRGPWYSVAALPEHRHRGRPPVWPPNCSHFLPRGATFGTKVLTCPIPGERNEMQIHDGGRHQDCLRLYPGFEPHGDPPTLLPPSAATSLQQCRKELKFGPIPRLGADRLPPRARPDPLRFQGW